MHANIKQDIIDATGLACPLPLLKLKQWLIQAQSGDRVTVMASDPGSARDIPRFVAASAHRMLSERQKDTVWVAEIEAGSG